MSILNTTTTNPTFTVYHADHGINEEQMIHIQATVDAMTHEGQGFFIHQVDMADSQVPCGLYGPAMGDGAVPDKAVVMEKRSEDRPADRLLKGYPTRLVGYVQCIGVRDLEANTITLFTVYGGPLAPQNPEDPTLAEERKAEAVEFWSKHALVG